MTDLDIALLMKDKMLNMPANSVYEESAAEYGGLCNLFTEVTTMKGGTEMDFDEFVYEVLKIEVSYIGFFMERPDGTIRLFTGPATHDEQVQLMELYLQYEDDPFGDHPLGRARLKLVERLINKLKG